MKIEKLIRHLEHYNETLEIRIASSENDELSFPISGVGFDDDTNTVVIHPDLIEILS